MWKVRFVMLALLALMLMTGWRVARALGAEPIEFVTLILFGVLPGACTGALVLACGRMGERNEQEQENELYAPESEDDAPYLTWPEPQDYD